MPLNNEATVTIDEQEVNKVLQLIQEASIGAIQEDTKVDWKILKNYAQDFLFGYNSLEEHEDMYTQQMLKQVVLADPNVVPYINKITGNQQAFLTRSKYLLATQFDEYLNKFREALPSEVVYVQSSSDGVISGSYAISMRELILNADKHGRLTISNARLKDGERKALEERQDLFPEEHIKEAGMAYNGTINRLQRFYEVTKKSGNAAQGGIIMWKENKEWILGQVTNKGDIKEAYIGFLMSQHENNLCKSAGGNPPYYSHPFIGSFFDNYISNVTNLSAVVEEDIVTNVMQYGIKSKKSQLPSINQYLEVAKWIVSQDGYLTKEDVEHWIRDVKFTQDTVRNIRLSWTQLAEKYGEDAIAQLSKTLS